MKLFEIMGKAHEGTLSRRRADVVCEASLADTAVAMGLGKFLLLGRGEDSSGGRSKPSILSDAFEALMGAIFIDGGYSSVKKTILLLLGDKIALSAEGKLSSDFKTKLQEYLQNKDHNVKIEYKVIKESGPDHMKEFTVAAIANDVALGIGSGASKAKAEQAAAENALSKGVD
jgi:ribonuclease-3